MLEHNGSFVRWQKITLDQLGYTVGLILAFSGAALGFALNTIGADGYTPYCWSKATMLLGLITQAASLFLGLWCVSNRLEDFRETMRIARCREVARDDGVTWGRIEEKLRSRRERTKRLGERTWCLFRWQLRMFIVGVVFIGVSFAITYHEKLF